MIVELSKPLPGTTEDDRYPDSNGRFMGDTDHHNVAILRIRQKLEAHFANEPTTYIATNLVMYYHEGDARKRRDPDVLVAKGVVGKHLRRSYRVWEESVLPSVLFEIASRRTWRRDLSDKRALYARIGIKEYFMFDPVGRYLRPALLGFCTVRGESKPIRPDAERALISKDLGLKMRAEGLDLRMFRLDTDEELLSAEEIADLERERADAERERADRLQEQVERLRAQIAAIRSGEKGNGHSTSTER